MRSGTHSVSDRASTPGAGSDLRTRFEELGAVLGDRLGEVVTALPRHSGPTIVASQLGITAVTASRLLKAIGQSDPIATLRLLPGPKPLQQIVASARRKGVSEGLCDAALGVVEEFGVLIRDEAGDRGALNAMLSAWLPDARRDFEAQRRQTIFKSMAEINGVSTAFELNSIVLAPSAQPGLIDVVDIKALMGLDRIRQDAIVQLGTQRLGGPTVADPGERSQDDPPRIPTNLDGDPALDGLHTVRLDEFCGAAPAPLIAKRFGAYVQYSLGPTGFGPRSKVDLVLAEVNRAELELREPNAERPPYFYALPETASRRIVFDLVVHEDVYPDSDPDLIAYDTAGRGPAVAGDPGRELDLRHVSEPLENLGPGIARMRLLEFPRYGELQRLVFDKLGWKAEAFRSYRAAINFPLVGTQLTLSFARSGSSAS